MLFTSTDPARQADRIYLYPRADAAMATGEGRSVYRVAVRFDVGGRRVVPLWPGRVWIDPAWAAPAELHADGSITAKGPIPCALFVGSVTGGPLLLIVEDHAM